MPNIVLIGMPGSGKSSLAKALATKMSLPFVDIDEMITDYIKMPISDFFALEGEAKFREYESLCAIKVSQLQRTIISTGGGIILKEENMQHLTKNGIIFFIERSIESISKNANLANRPLIKNDKDKLVMLYNNRINLYKKYAMHTINNEATLENARDKIIEIYNEVS